MIREIKTRRAECVASVNERIAEAQDMIKDGDIIAAGFVLVHRDGSVTTGFSETDMVPALMGGAFELLAKIQKAAV